MARVSLHYDDGTTVEANEVSDLLFHIERQGSAGVVGIFEDRPGAEPCGHCGGTGRNQRPEGRRLLTRVQIDDQVGGR